MRHVLQVYLNHRTHEDITIQENKPRRHFPANEHGVMGFAPGARSGLTKSLIKK